MLLVALAQPCSGCRIVEQLMWETLQRLRREHGELCVERVRLEHPSAARSVAGLEVERYPALIIGDEQVTAGSLLDRRRLGRLLEELSR